MFPRWGVQARRGNILDMGPTGKHPGMFPRRCCTPAASTRFPVGPVENVSPSLHSLDGETLSECFPVKGALQRVLAKCFPVPGDGANGETFSRSIDGATFLRGPGQRDNIRARMGATGKHP